MPLGCWEDVEAWLYEWIVGMVPEVHPFVYSTNGQRLSQNTGIYICNFIDVYNASAGWRAHARLLYHSLEECIFAGHFYQTIFYFNREKVNPREKKWKPFTLGDTSANTYKEQAAIDERPYNEVVCVETGGTLMLPSVERIPLYARWIMTSKRPIHTFSSSELGLLPSAPHPNPPQCQL